MSSNRTFLSSFRHWSFVIAVFLNLTTAVAQTLPPAEKGPFRQPNLVELIRLDPTLKLDIRYASANNFVG